MTSAHDQDGAQVAVTGRARRFVEVETRWVFK
jgi:hypothetical protein